MAGLDGQNGIVEVRGADAWEQVFNRLLTDDPTMDREVRKLIGRAMRKARTMVSRDIDFDLPNDPRQAAKAVKSLAYKRLFGGNVSILNRKKASSTRVTLMKERKLQPGQWGGNRRKRSKEPTERIDSYFGSDRGFILRFLNSGTGGRETRYGARGHITGNNMFGRLAPTRVETAVDELSEEIVKYMEKVAEMRDGGRG